MTIIQDTCHIPSYLASSGRASSWIEGISENWEDTNSRRRSTRLKYLNKNKRKKVYEFAAMLLYPIVLFFKHLISYVSQSSTPELSPDCVYLSLAFINKLSIMLEEKKDGDCHPLT